MLNDSKEYSKSLYNVYNQYVSGDNLYQIFNCNFLNNSLKLIYMQLNENLAGVSINIGSIIILLSFLNTICLFFVFIVIFKSLGEKKIILKKRLNKDNDENIYEHQRLKDNDKSNMIEMSNLNLKNN